MATPRHSSLGLVIVALVLGALSSCAAPDAGEGTEPQTDEASEEPAGNPEIVQPAEWWRVHPRPVYETLEKAGTYQEWFDVFRLTPGTYAIYEPNQFEEAMSYLVEGSDRAVLIDTGNGIGNIREVVESLTDLPVSVILTHEHYDHVAGAWHFEEVGAFDNSEGLARLAQGRSNASLQQYLTEDYLWKPLPEDWDPSAWTIPPLFPSHLYEEGHVIDLGGRTLEVIYTPGHSPGSMCLLDRENRLLFTGDLFFPGPLYAFGDDVDLELYVASIRKLSERLAEYDYVLSGHNDPWVSSDVIPRVGEAFQTIFRGEGDYAEGDGLRRYRFDGFDIIVRAH